MRHWQWEDNGLLELVAVDGDQTPEYTAVSFTWGDIHEEPMYDDFRLHVPYHHASDSDLRGGDSWSSKEPGLEEAYVRHEAARSSVLVDGPLIESKRCHEACTARESDLKAWRWQTPFPKPHEDQNRHKNVDSHMSSPRMKCGKADDDGFETESTDWDSSSFTSSDFSEDENEMAVNAFVDILVDQITQRAYIPASMLDLSGNSYSLDHQGDLNIGNEKLEVST